MNKHNSTNENSNGSARKNQSSNKDANMKKAKAGASKGTANGGGMGQDRYDVSYKILLLGNSGVGKTSLIRALMGESFYETTISTIGIDLAKKIFQVGNHRIQLEIWDTAGQEQYRSIVSFHFRNAKGYVMVYDLTNAASFEQMRKYWLQTADQVNQGMQYNDDPIPVFFAANKADMTDKREVTAQQCEQLSSQQSAFASFETSAKTGLNVQNLFYRVAEAMISTWGTPKRLYEIDPSGNYSTLDAPRSGTVRLEDPPKQPLKKICCKIK